MKVNTIKDLQKLVQLCRKTGIDAIEVDGVKLNLGPAPKRQRRAKSVASDFPEADLKVPQYTPSEEESTTEETISTDELTPEQLLMWSSASSEQQDTPT